MRRAASVTELYNEDFPVYNFDGTWLKSFGTPEKGKPWFFMAPVGSGKTTFVAMLCKYFSGFGRVAYNSIEEGKSLSLKKAFKRAGLIAGDKKVVVLDKEYYEEMCARLDKHKSPDIIVIDTIQHSDITKSRYLELKQRYPKKTFIYISHMEGKKPQGTLAQFIYQDADIKCYIDGFVVFPKSRHVDGVAEPFIIYEKGAADYHGLDFINGLKAS